MNSLRIDPVSPTGSILTMGMSILVLVLLIGLHILSPEFNPAWRMVSEYANGKCPMILSAMFFLWGAASWALAYTLWPHLQTTAGKIGLVFLILAGSAKPWQPYLTSNHKLHGLSAMIGIPSLSIAAMLISVALV